MRRESGRAVPSVVAYTHTHTRTHTHTHTHTESGRAVPSVVAYTHTHTRTHTHTHTHTQSLAERYQVLLLSTLCTAEDRVWRWEVGGGGGEAVWRLLELYLMLWGWLVRKD